MQTQLMVMHNMQDKSYVMYLDWLHEKMSLLLLLLMGLYSEHLLDTSALECIDFFNILCF